MDDSLTLWHNVWKCKDETKDLQQDIRVALFSVTMLVIVIALFYAGSYIQTEQAQANLIQCEWIGKKIRKKLKKKSEILKKLKKKSEIFKKWRKIEILKINGKKSKKIQKIKKNEILKLKKRKNEKIF